ncbi:MAG: ABC transporter ATP-binding protein, partial [Propionibacterium sp.]|nr:ABC transporter ATP-binding protein [Propionibacterium sp.]
RRAERARADEALAARPWGVTIGGVDVSRFDLGELRSRVLVSDTSSLVFAGTLQRLLDPHGRRTRAQAEQAIRVANAEDVYDALPGGWQGVLDERGRGLSGGQRQRLVLARAVLSDPEVLVLVEPTSAVDAHTEVRIAERLAAHRRGRTTIVTTVSPLVLHHADTVVLIRDGVAVARGRHHDLLASNDDYRAVVARGMDPVPPPGHRLDATSRRPDGDDEPVPLDEPLLVAPYGPVPMADRVRDDHWEVSE